MIKQTYSEVFLVDQLGFKCKVLGFSLSAFSQVDIMSDQRT